MALGVPPGEETGLKDGIQRRERERKKGYIIPSCREVQRRRSRRGTGRLLPWDRGGRCSVRSETAQGHPRELPSPFRAAGVEGSSHAGDSAAAGGGEAREP